MKTNTLLSFVLIFGIFLFSGCHKKTKDFQKEVAQVGDAMCRSMEIMNKLKAVNPEDTATVQDLQKKSQEVQAEMGLLYSTFKEKYGSKLADPAFQKDFRTEIKKAMLNCKYLSKEDREKYEKEVD
jgi:hypothetical protein